MSEHFDDSSVMCRSSRADPGQRSILKLNVLCQVNKYFWVDGRWIVADTSMPIIHIWTIFMMVRWCASCC